MQHVSLQPRSADAFGFLDAGTHQRSRGDGPRRLLLKTVAARLHLVDLPGVRLKPEKRWAVDVQDMGRESATRAIASRVRLARRHGFDVGLIFEIDEIGLRSLAITLASLLHDARNGRPKLDETGELVEPVTPQLPIRTIPGYEDLVYLTGLPGEDVTDLGRWFRKALLQHERQLADYFGHCMQEIGRYASSIVSSAVLASRGRQLDRQAEYASSHRFVSIDESGQQHSIKFADAANTAHRRSSKIYARLKGLDVFCTQRGLAGYYVTLTLPPAFHPNPSNGKRSWSGATPRDGHDELQRKWRRFQRRFGEAGGKCFGVRVEEPHDDGCPHWHLLLYVAPEREPELLSRIAEFFGNGCAAKVEPIDRQKGTGATYLMKYIRPICRADSGGDSHDGINPGSDSKVTKTARYDAFRATWGGRCIQFFDVPGSATTWDELRRIRPNTKQFTQLNAFGLCLHAAAVTTNYAEFLTLLVEAREGGDGPRVRVVYGKRDAGTRYVQGIDVDGACIDTHLRQWTVEVMPGPHEVAFKKNRTVTHSYPRVEREAHGTARHSKEAKNG